MRTRSANVGRAQHGTGELIKHQVQVPEQGAKRLPVIVFVVGIENQGVCDLALQMLHNRMVLSILLRDVFC